MQNITQAELIAELEIEAATLAAHLETAAEIATPLAASIAELFARNLADVRAFLAHLKAANVQTVAPTKQSARCPHYASVRAFFGAARAAGLDTNENRSRGAVSLFLGRRIESRAQLTGTEWSLCADAIRDGRLFW